jgi:hypothetical protein
MSLYSKLLRVLTIGAVVGFAACSSSPEECDGEECAELGPMGPVVSAFDVTLPSVGFDGSPVAKLEELNA